MNTNPTQKAAYVPNCERCSTTKGLLKSNEKHTDIKGLFTHSEI